MLMIIGFTLNTKEGNMNKEQNYRNLISGILTYPNRASLMLDANQHLLDSGLLQIMEQVATNMAANSSIEAASFLQKLMSELKDELIPGSKNTAFQLEGEEIEIKEVDRELEWSKWSGLTLMLGNILFVVMILL